MKSTKARPELIPENDKLEVLDEAYMNVLKDDDVGMLEKLFGVQSRVSSDLFKQSLHKKHFGFLQPHEIRQIVGISFQKLLAEDLDAA